MNPPPTIHTIPTLALRDAAAAIPVSPNALSSGVGIPLIATADSSVEGFSLHTLKFADPGMFLLLIFIPALLALRSHLSARTESRIADFVPRRLHPLLVSDPARRPLRFAILLMGAAAAILASARPQWTQAIDSATGRGRDVIIAVDVSRSMLADDLPPSRLKRAQMVAEDLVRQLKADRIGLVAFAGSSFLQAPVTADHASVLAAMQELSPELIPLPGTNISAALRCAEEAFDHSEAGQRALVLITDGEELEEDSVALAQQLSAKMRIFTIGVGSAEGSVLSVPAPNGGVEYIKDASGNVVRSKLDEARLKQIAEAGGGFYTRLVSGPAEVRHIIEAGISLMDEHELQLEGRTITAEGYQWPLGLGVLLITLGFILGEGVRKRPAVAASFIVSALATLGLAPKADAAVNQGDGRQLYSEGQYAQAQEAFQSDLTAHPKSPQRAFNLGAAAYKNQNWAEAIDAFGKALQSPDKTLRSRAEFNFANTLVQQARQGRRGRDNTALQQAVDHYEESLRADPSFEDARTNLEFVKKLLTQPPQQEQQQSKDSKEKDPNQKQKPNDQKNPSDSDQSDKSDSNDSESGEKGEKQSGSDKGEKKEKDPNSKQEKDSKSGEDSPKEEKEPKGAEGNNQPQGKEENLPDQKEKGELKNSPVDAPDKPQPEKREESQAGGTGQITREQARALLEALRSEDRRVNLWMSENQKQAGKLREGKTW